MQAFRALERRMVEISRINQVISLLDWDQQCFMPKGGAGARAEHVEVLTRIAHDKLTAPDMAELFAKSDDELRHLAEDSDERLCLRAVRRDYARESKLPGDLVATFARETSLAHDVWVSARRDQHYGSFEPTLAKIVALSREVASCLGYEEHPYDALLDRFEPGVLTREVDGVFSELGPRLRELMSITDGRPQVDDSCLRREFPEDLQEAFCREVSTVMGFDWEGGRLDRAVHPFSTSFGRTDVRMTTRYDRNWLPCSLMGAVHEAGHSLYEQGLAPEDDASPLSMYASMAIHESQSRLWENVVGRSKPFWSHFFPKIQKNFAPILDDVTELQFFRALNRVEPSYVRVESDELTYHLHILLRFELEKKLIEGSLSTKDASEAWNLRFRELFGITPPNDALGILQDVHWSSGSFGYFPTYTLGSLFAAQLFEKAVSDNPSIPEDIARGELGGLLAWLRTHIHRPGRRWLPRELAIRATGAPIGVEPFVRSMKAKLAEVYGI